jgi:hypothetical protein
LKAFFLRKRSPPSWLYPRPSVNEILVDDETQKASDDVLLDGLQKSAFEYFVKHTHRRSGLVPDSSREGSPSSIAAIGFACSTYPIAIERGWIARAEAADRILRALRFFAGSDQSGGIGSTGYRGFYFHFLDMESGTRAWQCELSVIDTALLLAGVLTAAAYFKRATADETELRMLADALYRRADWSWAQNGGDAVALGWKPEHGFLSYGWQGYNEALILYVLGLGSPTHTLSLNSFRAWTMTYQWENLYGYDVLYAGPLFVHQLSHAWIDLRGLRDQFMREKRCDYFENSRRATYVHREYARRNPLGFSGYADDCWGLSAGDGPTAKPALVDGRKQSFFGYAARGAPYGPDDGTLAGSAAVGSLPFAPEIVLPVVRRLAARESARAGQFVLASGFNATLETCDGKTWTSEAQLGFDQGLIALMIENFRTELTWQLSCDCPYIRLGLQHAGFKGGWLDKGAASRP